MNNRDFDDAASQELRDYEVIVKPSFFTRISHFMIAMFGMVLGTLGVLAVPEKGLWLHKLIHININLFKVKLSYEFLTYPLFALILISFIYFLYHYMYIKLYTVKVSRREMVEDKSIFGGADNTDLNNVTDVDVPNNLFLTMLGIRPLQIQIRGRKERLVTPGFKKSIADKLATFIRANSYENYTEYRVAKDRHKEKKNRYQEVDRRREFDRDEILDENSSRRGRDVGYDDHYDHKGRSDDGEY